MQKNPSNNSIINQGVAVGNALAAQAPANTGPDLVPKVGGPVIIEVFRSDPSDLTALLLNIETEEVLTEDEFTKADLIHWRDGDQYFIRKNSAGGPVGYVTPEAFAAVVAGLTKGAEVPEFSATTEPVTVEPTVAATIPTGTDEGVESLTVPTAADVIPEQESEAVVQLAVPVAASGPFFRKENGAPFDLTSSTASFIYYLADAQTAFVLRNAFTSRRAPSTVRLPRRSRPARVQPSSVRVRLLRRRLGSNLVPHLPCSRTSSMR